MKVLQAAVLVAALIQANTALRLPDPSWAVEVKRSSGDGFEEPPPPQPSADCKNSIFTCANCTTSRVCRPVADSSITHYMDINCPEERPYCDSQSGTCVDTASLDCGDSDDKFICLEKNHFFPDSDCKMFHYCDENYKPKLFRCIVEGTVYDADRQHCVPELNPSSCGKFDCQGHALLKMKHSNFPRYYAMCKSQENADAALVVGVCPPYYEVDPKTQVCEADCKSHGDGNIPDAQDCTKYFACSETKLQDGTTYMIRTPKSCPSGESFDLSLFLCVPDPDKKICNQ